MANWTILKNAIVNAINKNGNQKITGSILQNVLNNIVSSVGENASFVGVANPTTSPAVPDGPSFYIAYVEGSYVNFGADLSVNLGEIAVFINKSGTWTKQIMYKSQNAFIDIDKDYPLYEGFYTSESARMAIPKTRRSIGMIITYRTANRQFTIEQYVVPDLSDTSFKNSSYWRQIPHTDEIQQDISSVYELFSVFSEKLFSIYSAEDDIALAIHSMSVLKANGEIAAGSAEGQTVNEYNIDKKTFVKVWGRSPGISDLALAAALDADNNVLAVYYVGMATDYNGVIITLPQNSHILRIYGEPPHVKSGDIESQDTNYWKNKILWWCGTSIPAGSDAVKYPKQVGIDLGATVFNEAIGGSMCRANVRTGDYNGADINNITSALSMTNEEVENFIINYDTLRQLPKNNNWPESLSAQYIDRLRAASFENKLLPYLNGAKSFPDLFVIDHGHNDYKYSLSTGQSDISLEPTLANIQSGELAEDIFMTDNDCAKLETFFGSLDNIPSSKKEEFIASVNRNCYIGAINFIITLILKYNPHARFVFISNYEYKNGDNPNYASLIDAQKNIADSWAFPLCEVYKYLGFNNHIIPHSMTWFNNKYPSVTPASYDITCFKAYNPDSVHPHSDISGDANKNYAGIIAEFIKTCR